MSKEKGQQGGSRVDTLLKQSVNSAISGHPKEVFWNREENHEGWQSDSHPHLYIDYSFYMDFEDMPEVARTYLMRRAARRFAEQQVGDPDLSAFTARDELFALRSLRRQHGMQDRPNLFNQVEQLQIVGWPRIWRGTGVIDDRASEERV